MGGSPGGAAPARLTFTDVMGQSPLWAARREAGRGQNGNISAIGNIAARWSVRRPGMWAFPPASMTLYAQPAAFDVPTAPAGRASGIAASGAAGLHLDHIHRLLGIVVQRAADLRGGASENTFRQSDRTRTILQRIPPHQRLDWLSRLVAKRMDRPLKRYVSDPAAMIRFVPAAYLNQYGRLQPIGRMDWTAFGFNSDGSVASARIEPVAANQITYREEAPLSPQEREAQQFFQDVNRLFGSGQSGGTLGHVTAPGIPSRRPTDIIYKQNEADVTGKLASQQFSQPRSLNQPLKPQREMHAQADAPLDERQISRMADKVFDQIERRIRNERRRFGL